MEIVDRQIDDTSSPADVALHFRAIAKRNQTLKPAESRAYRAAVWAMRRTEGRERQWIADYLGMTPSAVSKLLRHFNPATSCSRTAATEGATS